MKKIVPTTRFWLEYVFPTFIREVDISDAETPDEVVLKIIHTPIERFKEIVEKANFSTCPMASPAFKKVQEMLESERYRISDIGYEEEPAANVNDSSPDIICVEQPTSSSAV